MARHDLITHTTNSYGCIPMCSCGWQGDNEPCPIHDVGTPPHASVFRRRPELAKERAVKQWNDHVREATQRERDAHPANT